MLPSQTGQEMYCISTTYKCKKLSSIGEGKVLVTEQDIINTYSEADQTSCKKYAEYLQLIKENPSYGYKRCAKILSVKEGQTRWWHTKGEKRAIPLPLKTVEKLKAAGLLPFTEKHKYADLIFNMLGVLFGDGGVDCRLNTLALISSGLDDVTLWKEDLLKIFPYAKDKLNMVEGGEWGHSYNMRTFDRSIIRFFVALGAPVGDKVAVPYTLPTYLFDLCRENRVAFLDGILASEIGIPNFRDDNRSFRSKRFVCFAFGMSKIDALEDEYRDFLNNVKELCTSVGLTSTPLTRKELSGARQRKDGNTSHCYRIFFQTHYSKILWFNDNFILRYANDKKKRLGNEINEAKKFRGELEKAKGG